MVDRKSANPGYVRLTQISGDIFKLERADNPEKAGTRLDAANLLSNNTSALYEMDAESSTPDKVFAKIAERLTAAEGNIDNLVNNPEIVPIERGGTGQTDAGNAVYALFSRLAAVEKPTTSYSLAVSGDSVAKRLRVSDLIRLISQDEDLKTYLINAISNDNALFSALLKRIEDDENFLNYIIAKVKSALISYGTQDYKVGDPLETGKLYFQYSP